MSLLTFLKYKIKLHHFKFSLINNVVIKLTVMKGDINFCLNFEGFFFSFLPITLVDHYKNLLTLVFLTQETVLNKILLGELHEMDSGS